MIFVLKVIIPSAKAQGRIFPVAYRRNMSVVPVRIAEMYHEGDREEHIYGELENLKVPTSESSKESRHSIIPVGTELGRGFLGIQASRRWGTVGRCARYVFVTP